jgi:hypothetical protein
MKFLTATCALILALHRADAALGGPKDSTEDVVVVDEKDHSSSWGSFRQMLAPIFGTNDPQAAEEKEHQQMLMLVDQDYDEEEDEHVLPRRGLSYYYNRYHNGGGYHNGYGRSHGYGYNYDNDNSYDNSYDGYGYGRGRSYSYGRHGSGRTHYRYNGYDNDGYSYDNGYD